MGNQLPISPITGQPSQLTALVRRSVLGPDHRPGDVVDRQPGGSELVYDPAAARAANLPVPGLQPGQQLSQGRGLSPRDAVRAGQPVIPARREVSTEAVEQQAQVMQAVVLSVGRAVAMAVQAELRPVVQELSAAVASASRQPVTRSAHPGRSIALNEGPGYRGVPASYNSAVVARSLGYDVPVPMPGKRLPNAVELMERDRLERLKRNGLW